MLLQDLTPQPLFDEAIKTNKTEIKNYQSTFNLVNILIEENDKLTPKPDLSFLEKKIQSLKEEACFQSCLVNNAHNKRHQATRNARLNLNVMPTR